MLILNGIFDTMTHKEFNQRQQHLFNIGMILGAGFVILLMVMK